jgi:hypothetical protein
MGINGFWYLLLMISLKFIPIEDLKYLSMLWVVYLVYECLAQHQKSMLSPKCPTTNSNPSNQQIPAMRISLNSREDIFKTFQPFFQQVYNYMFPSSMLAASLEKPNPGGLFNA